MKFIDRLDTILEEKQLHHVCFVVRIPKDLAKLFPEDRGAGDDSPPHITVLYIGTIDKSQAHLIHKAGRKVIKAAPKMECFIGGLAYFSTEHEGKKEEVAHSMVECKGLATLNRNIWEACLAEGVEVAHKYPEYCAHATLKYLKKRDYDGELPSGSFDVTQIEIWHGEGRRSHSIKLGG